ncbi:unnamed protein product [Penicillium glandicola]
MEPSRPPHLDSSSPVPMAAMDDDKLIVTHVFVNDQRVTGGRNRAAQENLTIVRSSTESDNNLQGQLPSPLLESTSQFAAPVDSQDLPVPQTIESNISQDEWIEQQPLNEVDPDFINPNTVQFREPTLLAEERRTRWVLIQSLINYDDTAIARALTVMFPFDIFPGCDFYTRYVRGAWVYGPDAMIEAKSRLDSKLRNHERYLEEVNEVIALDPQISPGNACYNLRVYNINERARVLSALDEHHMLMGHAEPTGMNNANVPEGIAISQNPTHSQMQPERRTDYDSSDHLSGDGTNEVERTNINRRVDIIDPDTGHPIKFQKHSLTKTNKKSNGTIRADGKNSDFDNMQVDGSSDLMIRAHGDGNDITDSRPSLSGEIQVDRRSELWIREMNEASGNVPVGSNDPLFDAISRSGNRFSPELGSESEQNEITAWISQETWTERRPRNGRRISNTLPRNFGRNIYNFRSELHSITEIDHDEHAFELADTAANDESLTPSLMFNISEDEVNHPTEDGATQNGPFGTSVSGSSDDERQMISDSSPGPGLNEEMISEISLDRQHGSTESLDYQSSLIPPDFFDVFVVDVDGDWDVEGTGDQRGRTSAQQSEDGMNHSSRSGSFTLTMNSLRGDYPDDMDDTPLLSRNSPFGRYSPLSRNSPSRVVSRSSIRRRYNIPEGGLSSSIGSRMISSSLNARRRHDARENVRNARRSLSSSRLIDELRDEVPATTILGFDAPDSQQNTNYLPVYSSHLINASVRHTAPAIVNTSRINAHAHH